jgi:hypothetical protein
MTLSVLGIYVGGRLINECAAISGMRICMRNRSIRREPALVSPCPLYIPRDLTSDRTMAATVGGRRLISCAMAQQLTVVKYLR